ncbi:hypothetical protein OMAG_002891 [Candidatus Omnitrophus magneticus]|uniref:Uncharacterized protein n=1 Tax=Candidatus Omnitrophus magneticus TaxID=1609969 RepID=A0A0F0CJ38_9BACT|nr:hypothetical protein OMAG_002891 [Candidatus Omnitrophus magneticus]
MNRNLKITILISAVVHILAFSFIIVTNNSNDNIKIKSYSKLKFLGPLLKKTAFDIMIESMNPNFITSYTENILFEGSDVKIEPLEKNRVAYSAESRNNNIALIENKILDVIAGQKNIPDFLIKTFKQKSFSNEKKERNVVYKPSEPFILKGLYGDSSVFTMRVKVFISKDGTINSVEPVTTTGNSETDMILIKYVRNWIFESGSIGNDFSESEIIDVSVDTKTR